MPSFDHTKILQLVAETSEQYSLPKDFINEAPFKSVVSERLSSAKLDTYNEVWESQLTGTDIPRWILPLQFEKNLNSALDSLNALDGLLKEYREILFKEIQNNFVAGMLSDRPDEEYLLKHKQLSEGLNVEASKHSLERRLAHCLIDLIEYSKASKIGAKVLFNISLSEIEKFPHDEKPKGLSFIRETLRRLLISFRKINNKEHTTTVSLSLKRSKTKNDKWLCSEWANDDRNWKTGLKEHVLQFDLSQSSQFDDLASPRIRRIGLQIIDSWSGRKRFNEGANRFNFHIHYPQSWSLVLQDEADGILLGEEADSAKHLIDDTTFKSVVGTREPNVISWSNQGSILNISPIRKWSLEVSKMSSLNVPTIPKKSDDPYELLDIYVHFDLSHQ